VTQAHEHPVTVASEIGLVTQTSRLLAAKAVDFPWRTLMDRRLGLDGDFDQLHPDTVAAYRRYSRARNQRRAL
jgi:hypothetical protein